jgi:hypothetical protein
MKCYYHPALDAVGTCKHCCKGLCPGCATDVGGGLACASTCVQAVTQLNSLINANSAATTINRGAAAYVFPLFLAAVGAVFVIEPFLSGRPGKAVTVGLIFGGVFLFFALVIGLYQRTWRRKVQHGVP